MLQKGFADFNVNVLSTENGVASVQVNVPDQAEVDRLIDQLRSHQISIVGIEEQRVSLEDAFLQLID